MLPLHCGDYGYRNDDGSECMTPLDRGQRACLRHKAEERAKARAAARDLVPPEAPPPSFEDEDAIVRWSEQMADRVVKGLLAPELSDSAGKHADRAMRRLELRAQKALTDALLQLERGGTAVVMLRQMLADPTAPRRPLPPKRVVALGDGDRPA